MTHRTLAVSRAARPAACLLAACLASGIGPARGWSAPVRGAENGFIANRGQLDARVNYYAIGERAAVYFTADALVLDLRERVARRGSDQEREEPATRGVALYIHLPGARAGAALKARGELPTRYSYFRGSDPTKWRGDVAAYEEIVYEGLWPDVDLAFRLKDGALAYQMIVRPGAEAAAPAFAYDGAKAIRPEGPRLERVETAAGAIVHARSGLSGEFRWASAPDREFSAQASAPAADAPDLLLWSTFLGGGGYDLGRAIALDDSGQVLVAGQTTSADFPATPGAYDTSLSGPLDVFVAQLSPAGDDLLWCTYLGGSGADYGQGLACDGSGNVLVAGYTASSDFPTTAGAYDTSFNGGPSDAFVAKLSPSGSALLRSTFLGGGNRDYAYALAVDPSGNAVVTGWTDSGNFPATVGAYDTSYNGGYHDGDAFVAKLPATLSALAWSTFLGGSTDDYGYALALDASRNVLVTGVTDGPTFPATPGAYDTSHNGGYDAFVAKISSAGSVLLWATFLGGGGDDFGHGVALDGSGSPVVTGYTTAPDFPTTTGAYDTSFNGGTCDGFVAKLSASGSALSWSSFLGGSGADRGYALALDGSGSAFVTGYTASIDFPTTPGACDTTLNGGQDVYVTRFSPSGSDLLGSTFLGGGANDGAYALALDLAGNAVVMGETASSDFPTTVGAYDTSGNGHVDVFAAKLEVGAPTSVLSGPAPAGAGVVQVLPNPTARGSTLRFTLSAAERVGVRIYDVAGRLVRALPDSYLSPGGHQIVWDGTDQGGGAVEAGIYLYMLEAGGQVHSGKLLVVR